MKVIRYSFFVGMVILFVQGCASPQQDKEIHPFDRVEKENKLKENEPKVSLQDLSFVIGNWIDSTTLPPVSFIEHWYLKQDTLIGERGTIQKGDTTISQVSKIVLVKGKPVYLLEPNGDSFVSFRLDSTQKDYFLFVNKANATPQKIAYKKEGEELILTITSMLPVGERSFSNRFFKR